MEENKLNKENFVDKINSIIEEFEYEIGKELYNKEGDLTREEQIKFGKALINCLTEEGVEVIDLSEKNPNISAVYVNSNKDRAIIVDSKKEILVEYLQKSNFDKHYNDYINGKRTELEIVDKSEEEKKEIDILIHNIDNKIKELEEKIKNEYR